MKNKKAQIGFFILIGLFILVMIIFFLIIQFSVSSKMKQDILTQQSAEVDSELVDSYIDSCVKDALLQGLIKLGESGGYIYDYGIDSSPSKITMTINEKSFDVSYGISSSSLPAPYYPNYQRITQKQNITWSNPYLLGQNNLRSLDDIQDSLEHFVVNCTIDCANLTVFEPAGITAIPQHDLNQSYVDITFGYDDVTLNIDWPVRIISSVNTTTIAGNYVAKQNVRFKSLYDLINAEIEKERLYFSNVIGVNKQLDRDSVTLVNLINRGDYDYNQYDNVLLFIDTKSTIKGNPYFFYTAVPNRLPALNYIGEKTTAQFLNDDDYDFIILDNEEIKFNLDAKDPDDDSNVSSDYELKFKYSCCNDNCDAGILNDLNLDDKVEFPSPSASSKQYCIRVNVSDEANLSDYQDVNILVITNPRMSLADISCDSDAVPKELNPNFEEFRVYSTIQSDIVTKYDLDITCGSKPLKTFYKLDMDESILSVKNYIKTNCNAAGDTLTIKVMPDNPQGVNIPDETYNFEIVESCS